MIQYKKRTLSNGLTVICNTDKSTAFACFNILYKVGSRNEDSERTGFAHLFEHLMFSGSKHVEDYDRTIELSGGENNAFTTNDFT
ncbi:MAG: insulinase family protein, partial [Odoribacter sp.]|nr:insulinase family protein [Odoribacter sp.]